MFEFLPRADAAREVPQRPLVDVLRENRSEKEAAARRKEQTTIRDGIGAAMVKGGVGFIDRFITELGFEPQEGYRIPEDRRKRWEALGIRPEQWALFSRATSDEHLAYLEHLAFQNQMADDDLSQFGVVSQIGLHMLDPVATGLDIATGGLGYAARAGRVANMARSGLQAGATSATLTAAQGVYDPELTLADGVTAAATSFALGAAVGARKGALYADDIDPDAVRRAAGQTGDGNLSAGKVDNLTDDPTPGVTPLRDDTDAEQRLIDRAIANAGIMPHFASMRRDLSARMGKLKSHIAREAGRILYRDPVGYTDRSIAVQESAGEFSKRHLATLETSWRRSVNAGWYAYKKANGFHWWNIGERRHFYEEVGRAIRGADGVSKEALQAAEGVRATLKDALRLAREASLPGFTELAPNANYLPRYFSPAGFQRLFGELNLSEDTVVRGLIKPAMRKAWQANLDGLDEIDEELLDAVAKAYVKRAQAHYEGAGAGLHIRPLDAESVEEIAKMLEEAGVSAVRSRDMLAKLERQAHEAGKLDRAKRRIDLDENFTTTLRNEAGEDVQVSMSDLFDNDVEAVMTRYLREITGWAALSAKAGIRNQTQLDKFKEQVLRDAKKAGDDVKSVERLLDIGINSTFNRSTELDPGSKASRYARYLRNWNFSRVMNQVGFSMFAELGTTIAHVGLRNYWNSVWNSGGFLRRAADGTLTSKEARVVEALAAPGTDLMRNPPFLHTDEGALVPSTFGQGRLSRFADNAMNAANHVTSIASGMAPINVMLQRMAARGMLLRLMDMAKAKKLSDAEITRLRSWGLDEKSQKDLFAYLKDKKRIEDIDPEAMPWETRERISAFMFRTTRHIILEPDASDSVELMHSVTGKLILQFRTFMVGSYTRHFLNSLHHYDDWRTYAMVTLSTASAGLGWWARTYLNTMGDPEAREKLLTREEFYKNAIAQSTWASIIPTLTDSVWSDMLGNDPVFANNRSTGLQNGVMGIPSVDLFNKVYSSGRMVGKMLDADEHITEREMADFWRIWFFNNMTGVRNLAAAHASTFPDRTDGTDR